MVNVNLISSRKRKSRKVNVYYIVLYSLFGLYFAFFAFKVGYVLFYHFTNNNQIKRINDELLAISTQITKESDKVNNYVLAKFILLEIERLNRSKFGYKKYLDTIVAMLPAGSELKSVDFGNKQSITFSVESRDLYSFNALEFSMRDYDLGMSDFASITVLGVNRLVNGAYSTNLVIGIKKENGK